MNLLSDSEVKSIINEFFIKLEDKIPKGSFCEEHLFCDFIELLAIKNRGDYLSIADVTSYFDEDSMDECNEDEYEEVDISDNRWEAKVENWFELLKYRQNIFNETYPFKVTNDNKIRLNFNSNNDLSYIALLLCSNLNYFKKLQNIFTTEFEYISYLTLKKYLPNSSKVFQFGKNIDEKSEFSGNIQEKMNTLAKKLGLITIYKENYFCSKNSGDGGIDLIAWIDFIGDENKNNIIYLLAQCASGKDWHKKQYESQKILKCINFSTPPINTMFIPYSVRNVDNEFNRESEILDILLFDRLRIINLIKNTLNSFNDSLLQKVAKQLIN